MAGFESHADHAREQENPLFVAACTRYGLILFAIYVVIYAVFVGLCALSPQVMGQPWAGLNPALWYGMFLLVAALVMALIYGWLCRRAWLGMGLGSGSPDTESRS